MQINDFVDLFGIIIMIIVSGLALTSTENPRITLTFHKTSFTMQSITYFFPSTIIIWYPNFVLTGGSV